MRVVMPVMMMMVVAMVVMPVMVVMAMMMMPMMMMIRHRQIGGQGDHGRGCDAHRDRRREQAFLKHY
jgi:hypothetical protein